MNRSLQITYFFLIISIGFIGGIIAFKMTTPAQSEWLISIMDPRLQLDGKPNLWQSLWPIIMPYVFLVLLATHQWFRHITRLVVVSKSAFFGFCSAYLIATQNAFWNYALWWFPVQFMYTCLLLLFSIVLVPKPFYNSRKKGIHWKRIIVISILTIIIFFIELLIIHFMF
ncbi:hypothetical protein ACIQ4I_05365 [Rummeliibacillus sp. NPDC094406]|uniref:hypothetical protein n=1 Tax=Rummeliibacillus TaxID=648802 RepID=UPI0037CB74CA